MYLKNQESSRVLKAFIFNAQSVHVYVSLLSLSTGPAEPAFLTLYSGFSESPLITFV